ncbi:S1C family serine protease [Noviherbaspirillum malthae]|uniref:S1C family serine protease n=1 Tax=Noviherbaspirillum malthae TaxID=1260987 RepID=UPI001E575CBC|nr:serine protease [Noviherbaspirillum malthae]
MGIPDPQATQTAPVLRSPRPAAPLPPPATAQAPTVRSPAPSTQPVVPPQAGTEKPTERKGSGSGFIVSAGYVVTNEHVISGCRKLTVRRGEGRHEARLARARASMDLALLEVPALKATKAPGIRTNALLGEDVTVAGHPLSGLLSADIIVTSGQVNALSGLRDDVRLLQISAPIQPGNSGGPLVDTSGNIVGVVVSKLDAARLQKMIGDVPQNVNFAIKPEFLREFLGTADVTYQTGQLGRRLENFKIAQVARTFTVQVECF